MPATSRRRKTSSSRAGLPTLASVCASRARPAGGRSASSGSTTRSRAVSTRRATRGAASWPASACSGSSANSPASRTSAASSRIVNSGPRPTACTAPTPGGGSATTGPCRASGSAARPSTRQATRRAARPGSPRWGGKAAASTTGARSRPGARTSSRTSATSAASTCARCSRKPTIRGIRRTAACCELGPTSKPWRCGITAGSCRTGRWSPGSRSSSPARPRSAACMSKRSNGSRAPSSAAAAG